MPIVDGETDGARLQDLLVLYMKQVLRRILIQIFPFFSTFRLRRLDENGRNLYNYICICCQNERRQGTYFTKIFKAQMHYWGMADAVGCVRSMVPVVYHNQARFT